MSVRRVVLGVVAAASVAVAVTATAPPVVAQPAFPAIPEFDTGFYSPEQSIVSAADPGQIIASRPVNVANLGVLPVNVDAWQLSYRSNDSRDEAIPAVATVLKPRGYVPGRPLLSFQIAEDSLGAYCASSYVLQQGSIPWPLTGAITGGAQFLEIQAALAQGWAVVVPDHQGPNSAFAAGPLAGRITLDGIRAAENFDPLGLDGRATKVGMMGYSGGSIATGHAAELHESYAPDLNIVGAAEGGIVADVGALVDNSNNALGAGIVASGIIGVSREDPELAQFIDQKLNPLGKAMFGAKQNLCIGWNSAIAPFVNLKGLFDTPGDPLREPVAQSALAKLQMGKSVPRFPMYMYQSNPDWLVPVGPVNTLVDTYCADPNASVTYTRDHFSEHLTLEVVAAPSALLWLRDRFAGVPAEPGCRTTDVGSMALDSRTWPVWQDVVGDLVAGLFGQPIGS
ncbi:MULTISPECIES: lipase family protein [Nocardiaceae]|uniref:lipase family protein n=1 Tax=Nocardiaceae TaxID=85025 RepID=UPI000399AE28|nr:MULTISPECIES: lipase family protein [Rhodococcus]